MTFTVAFCLCLIVCWDVVEYSDGFALRLFRTTDMTQGNVRDGEGGHAGPRIPVVTGDMQSLSRSRDIPVFAPGVVFATTPTTTTTTTTPAPTTIRPVLAGIFRPASSPLPPGTSAGRCGAYEDCKRHLIRFFMMAMLAREKDPLAAFRLFGRLKSIPMGSSLRAGSLRMFRPAFNASQPSILPPKLKTLKLPVLNAENMDFAKIFKGGKPILLHPRSVFTPWPEADKEARWESSGAY
ncbi:uncharacterized protein LOC129583096 isoform X2 [Paramacrobiotus metropolitanus]|uniref:uncharacterized protein LOC129583096 isoform X2 n=1 Tax=Paramacrobiotus metropolitanus TaxID=2943436 RepID=UPI002445F3CA|nr:uncharacterized protein LOC129583096 isoform X2 [Paramacrobiotus metropolitanus]